MKKLKPEEYSEARIEALQELGKSIEEIKQKEITEETKMKNAEKETYAEKVLLMLKESGVNEEDQRKVLSFAYRTLSIRLKKTEPTTSEQIQ